MAVRRAARCLTLAAVVSLCLVAAACGHGGSPGARGAGSPATTAGTGLAPPGSATSSNGTVATTAPGVPANAPPAAADWYTYHANSRRTGVAPAINLASAHAVWTTPLDGRVDAEPLVWRGLVIVATGNDTLYGLAAGSGKVVWRTHLATPVPLGALACGDVNPLGILGTPVIDPVTGHLFAVAETRGSSGAVGHELVALDPATGKLLFAESDVPAGMSPTDQQQRAGLIATGGRVYVSYGGLYGDCGTYAGWVVAAATSGPGPLVSYRVHTPNQAGIWAPPGPTLDGSGDLLVATGNGASTTTFDYGDSVIKLSPGLRVLDYFAPRRWAYDNGRDLDLGATGPALVDGGKLVFIVGKESEGYLLDERHLGGIGGQLYGAHVCFAIGGDAVEGDNVYVPCRSGIEDVRVSAGNHPSFTVAWSGAPAAVGPPIVAGGLVWSAGGSTLYGLSPANGAVVQRLALGSPAGGFATPAVGDGVMVIGAGDTVRAFAC